MILLLLEDDERMKRTSREFTLDNEIIDSDNEDIDIDFNDFKFYNEEQNENLEGLDISEKSEVSFEAEFDKEEVLKEEVKETSK